MKRVLVLGAALLGLAFIAAPAPAQYVPPGFPATKPSGTDFVQEVQPASSPAADMQEDVEIMRRLLDGAFAEAYGFHHGQTAPIIFHTTADVPSAPMSGWTTVSSLPLPPPVEGVYLKDYGVVYTVTLRPTGFDPLPAAKPGSGSKTPPDDWDRIRKEIRGETPAPETKVFPAHQPLSEVILKVLADNGKHFSLADGERISVAVTFRGAANCTNCHQNPWKGLQPSSPSLNQWQDWQISPFTTSTTTASGTGTTTTATGGSAAQPPPDASSPVLTDARNELLLGDLHMKQGKHQEAIAAYTSGADRLSYEFQQRRSTVTGLTKEDVPALLTAVDLLNKLAAAYVQSGNPETAAKMLKRAGELAKEAEGLTGRAVDAGKPTAALPAKLVVTVSKKQLNDMAAGKMTFEMLCQAATVEYVNPPAEKK